MIIEFTPCLCFFPPDNSTSMGSLKTYIDHLVLFPVYIIVLQGLSFIKEQFKRFISFIIPRQVPKVVRTPEDCFRGLEAVGYTFKPNYVELPIGGRKCLPRVHYVDEGKYISCHNKR